MLSTHADAAWRYAQLVSERGAMAVGKDRVGLGRLVARARHRARLSQTELAERAGIHRTMLNRYERGVVAPSFEMLGRLLGAAGFQVRMELEPLDDALDNALRRQARVSVAELVRGLGLPHASWLDTVDYRLVGNTAALLLGAPIVVDVAEIAVADTVETTQALGQCMRERRFWAFDAQTGIPAGLEPALLREQIAEFGRDGWLSVGVGVRVARMRLAPADEVARRVEVTADGHQFWVAPVHELATLSDPLAKRYLQRLSSGVVDA